MEPVHSRRESGQSLVEFGLLIALVAVVAIAGLLIFGGTVSSMMSSLSATVAFNVAGG
jgi:Flp pilus assembly pilin Flp